MNSLQNYHIRRAAEKDLPRLLELYAGARIFMALKGNASQWGNSYPAPEQIEEDIARGNLFAVTLEDREKIVGVFYYAMEIEPTYDYIENGPGWPDNEPYGVIHRMAGSAGMHGLARFCFDYCLKQCNRLRLDTHADNKPMLRAIEDFGFDYCGIIYVKDHSPRKAFALKRD
ncbi:Uncharacterised protein [Porphyromonas macacae]|uniref:N-acetyltransferase domain-containing protein n=1 Tax=Porphyromonas macacae TaxID=28115 RepID=A0A379E6N4_9PORP|nr:hypothetical protein [Porphyromonas macacae]SUB88373.1 Uncharacterised protein [Porphyromonas macacae]